MNKGGLIMDRKELKAKAKERLNGKKGQAALMLLAMGILIGLISFGVENIFPSTEIEIYAGTTITQKSFVASLVESIVTLFLALGAVSYFMKIARGEATDVGEIFSKGNLL
jgi:uncharacterized membrane protein